VILVDCLGQLTHFARFPRKDERVRLTVTERRSALLQAALRVIATRGVAAATTRAIVAEAGMPLASFHYAFRSRDEMMRELISLVVESGSVAVVSALRQDSDIRSAIRDGLQGYLEHVRADPGHEQVMFELMQYALRTDGLEGLAAEQYAMYHRSATGILEAGAESAGVAWSVPIGDVARRVVTITDGVTLAWLADRNDDAANRVLDIAADALAALTVPKPAKRPDNGRR
jgi:AcrR family transcriptional regulator